jgi:hypothetical protein
MVLAKEALIKTALQVEELPIQVGTDEIVFPWLRPGLKSEETFAYAQFITALCKTAKIKKRVTAKAPEGGFENGAFAMRVFLIGLGMVGPEFALARKLLVGPQSGNSAWRYGPPEKKAPEAAEDEGAEAAA